MACVMILMGCDKDNSYISYDHQFVRRCYGNGDEMGSSFLILAIFLPRYQLQALSLYWCWIFIAVQMTCYDNDFHVCKILTVSVFCLQVTVWPSRRRTFDGGAACLLVHHSPHSLLSLMLCAIKVSTYHWMKNVKGHQQVKEPWSTRSGR
jgi:hypothetical protein